MQLKIGYLFQCLPWARSFCPFRACGAKKAERGWMKEERGWMKEERGWMKEERDGWGVNRVNS